MNINLTKTKFLLITACIWNIKNHCDENVSIPLINIEVTNQEKPVTSEQLAIIEKTTQEEINAQLPDEGIIVHSIENNQMSSICIETEPQTDINRSQFRILYAKATAMIEQIINGIKERLNALYEWSATIKFNPVHNPYIDEDYLDEYKP